MFKHRRPLYLTAEARVVLGDVIDLHMQMQEEALKATAEDEATITSYEVLNVLVAQVETEIELLQEIRGRL